VQRADYPLSPDRFFDELAVRAHGVVTTTHGFAHFSGLESLKGMAKHCTFEPFLRFVKQIRPKPSVVVTLHERRAEFRDASSGSAMLHSSFHS
jgi:hypothetical protein